MRIPKDFNVFIRADESVNIILNNFDGNFLAFQILVLGIPLAIASTILGIHLNEFFFVTFALLVMLVYWCVYNYYDRTKFIFKGDCFVVLEGMHEREKLRIYADQFVRTEKRKKSGKQLTSGRLANTTTTKPVYQLVVFVENYEILVTEHVGPNGQVYLEEAINTWIKKWRGEA